MVVLGLRSLNRKVREMQRVANQLVRVAMEKQADEIVRMMKSLAPDDSGALRDSIGWTWGAAPNGARMTSRVRSRDGQLTITLYAGNDEAFYARMVEFGTPAHIAGGKFAGAEIPAIPANPYFYVAFRARRKQAKSAIRKALKKAAQQVASGASS